MHIADVHSLEKQRFSYRWKHILLSILGWLALLMGVFNIVAALGKKDISMGLQLTLGILLIFLAGIFALFVWWLKKKYAAFYRKNINSKITPLAFPDLYYNAEQHLPFEDLRQSGLILDFTDAKSEGYGLLSGLWNDINFQLSSFFLVHERHMHEGVESSIVFSGIVVAVSRPTAVKGTVAITQDIAERLFGNAIGGFLQKLNAKSRRQELVKINNAAFEQKFAVYADDYTDAQNLLDNRLCDWLLSQQQKQEQNAISKMTSFEVSVQPDKIYIVWKAKDPSKVDEMTETVQTPITEALVQKTHNNISQKLNTLEELLSLLANK